jgi:hypothetical protein
MYIFTKNKKPRAKSRNKTAAYRAGLRRKNTRRKLRVSGRKW